MKKIVPERKKLRLDHHNYSSQGAYFVTVCTQDKTTRLSEIVPAQVGDGAHDVPFTLLTELGEIVQKNLLSSEKIPGVKVDQYVIMPDHIHVIFFLYPEQYTNVSLGTSRAPSPTNEMLPHVISAFKRFCNKEIGRNIFQRGYYEHVIRDRTDYEGKVNYISNNPIRRYYNTP